MVKVCGLRYRKWLGYRVRKCMATLILYLRSKWHVCIAVISRFVWYGFLVFLMRKPDTGV